MSPRPKFSLLRLLERQAPLIGDGSLQNPLGTAFDWPARQPACTANLLYHHWVKSISQAYLEAGAKLVRTNTAGANRLELAAWQLEDRAEAINNNGMALAREVCGIKAFVGGCIQAIAPQVAADVAEAALELAYSQQLIYLSDTGTDFFILQGFDDLQELKRVLKLAHRVSYTSTVAHWRLPQETLETSRVLGGLRELLEAGAEFIGLQVDYRHPQLLEIIQSAVNEYGILSVILDESQPHQEPPAELEQLSRELLASEVAILSGGQQTHYAHTQIFARAWANLARQTESTTTSVS